MCPKSRNREREARARRRASRVLRVVYFFFSVFSARAYGYGGLCNLFRVSSFVFRLSSFVPLVPSSFQRLPCLYIYSTRLSDL